MMTQVNQSNRTAAASKQWILGAALCASFIPQIANAGAWVAEKGQGYTKYGATSFNATDFFGENDDFQEFDGDNISFYGEYGLGNKTAIYGSVLFQDIEQTDSSNNTTSNSGLGDVEFGVRYQWQANPFVLSTSFLVKLPFLYDENDDLPLGNGQLDYEGRVLIGKSLNKYGYFGLELGYRFRAEDPSDEIRYLVEYGFSFNDNVYFRTKLDGIESADNGNDGIDGNGNLSTPLAFDVGRWELTLGYNFGPARPAGESRWGVEVTFTQDVFGDNTLDGDSVQLGLTRVF
jgi:hypothetical protein